MKFNPNDFKLQIISHRTKEISDIEFIHRALKGGAKWIQLRQKDFTKQQIIANAQKVKELCQKYNAIFIIDDNVEICKELDLDGVHLGKNDMKVEKAREILGQEKIIGSTCNTLNDILEVYQKCDYIGLGPFRFTTTKKNLSTILGLEGYQKIFESLKEKNINIPITTIGGITLDDIEDLQKVGVESVAISSQILLSQNIEEKTKAFLSKLTRIN